MSQPTTSVLDRILEQTREEVARRKRERPLETLAATAAAAAVPGAAPPASALRETSRRRFHEVLSAEGVGVIAEFKRRSPSAGTLREQPDLASLVRAYERGGAVAVSVLTEGPNFEGALEDLATARGACALPLLRKDFIVDAYQLHEALAAGADAVLLIVAALEGEQLASLHGEARSLGLDVLVEVHDGEELATALETGADIIGVNNRDLRDFSVDVGRTEALMGEVPPGVIVVSESGIVAPEQVLRLQERGVQAVLVGETLMRSLDPAAAVRTLTSLAADTRGTAP
jgi:indole-3-glycerol phosphate synthase